MPNYSDDQEQDISWKKPDWATGNKLKSTGKGQQMMTEGNLASAITNLPHSKGEGEGNFSKPEWTGGVGESTIRGDLAKPITNLPHAGEKDLSFEKPAWTQNAGLRGTGKGEALKSGKEIARPIGGIKAIDV
jgi:hypothetical protein